LFTSFYTNERGNRIESGFWPAERYDFDFDDEFRKEWKQFDTDQDAHCFGTWTRKLTLQTFTYAEGDITLVTCPDVESYNREVHSMIRFYGEGYAFAAVDIDRGTVTLYYEDRAQHLVEIET